MVGFGVPFRFTYDTANPNGHEYTNREMDASMTTVLQQISKVERLDNL